MVSEYIGCGDVAKIVAKMDEDKRNSIAAQRQLKKDYFASDQKVYDEDDALSGLVDGMVKVCLEAGGFHKHKGQWRKKREEKK